LPAKPVLCRLVQVFSESGKFVNRELTMTEKFHLGLDVGSGTCKFAVMSQQGTVHYSDYRASHGRPLQVAYDLLSSVEQEFGTDGIRTISCTGTGGKRIASILNVPFVNEVICHTKAVEFYHPEAKTIIDIGGEDAKLIIVNSNQNSEFYIQDFALNTVCAAGTGAFLEQQASRMGYSLQEFSKMALKAELIPSIAGRCTVFAKSDMIHLQQNGMPDYEVVAGLCFAIVRNLKTNIAKGKEIKPPLIFQGGVAANLGVRRAMRETLVSGDQEFLVPENFKIMGAIGASLEGMRKGNQAYYPGKDGLVEYFNLDLQDAERLRPLRSCGQPGKAEKNPCIQNNYQSDSSRGRKGAPVKAYLGIDVGSVSTKLALLSDEVEYGSILTSDKQLRVLAKTYLSTSANPLEALKTGMQEIYRQLEQEVQIAAVGTTGSGRYLSGDFVGADIVRNEITAQATAAEYINPGVDTIFEIGGQDSKYIFLQDGVIKDFAMNKVCAAGTGSFLEEQSVRLGLDVKDFGNLALSSSAPVKMGERCTVFMQSDLVHFQQKGAVKEDLAAGLCYSIVTNYLNKVVEQRQIGENIVFQGGTAYNEGIVSAFESMLDKEIQVPEHNEITGAIGAAVLASREQTGQTAFKGFDLNNKDYTTRIFECKGCTNRCEIQQIKMEDEDKPFYYGHRCERYERDAVKPENKVPDLVRYRESAMLQWSSYQAEIPADSNKAVIGIPRVLYFQEWLPFFSKLLTELGFEVVISDSTNKDLVAQGSSKMITETCLPIKVANGHVQNLLHKGVDRIFLPQVCTLPGFDQENGFGQVCPYVQGLPWTIRATFDFESRNCKVYTPVFHLGKNQEIRDKEWKEFAGSLNVGWGRMKKAISSAWQAQNGFQEQIQARGREILQNTPSDQKMFLLIGRPYNAFDPGLNMDISKKLQKMGILGIPLDLLPLEEMSSKTELSEMYWTYGQKILIGGRFVQEYSNLYPVYLTNFSCGPDAFILHFFEQELGERPYLELEIDEHTADAGVVTRLEAFWDSIKNRQDSPDSRPPFVIHRPEYRKDSVLYLPPMTDHLHAFASAFAHNGVAVELMPDSDEYSLDLGRKYTKGKECLPAVITTGDIVKKATARDFDPNRSAFFMPSAGGPCRFGLYHQLHRLVLDDLGMNNVPVYSPNQSYTLYEELGVLGKDFNKLAWKGVVAVDLLIKFLLETRPYVENKDLVNRTYNYYLQAVSERLAEGGDPIDIIVEASQKFRDFPGKTDQKKPRLGIVGEIYVRSNPFANEFIVQNLEELGVEVWLPTISEWIHYVNYTGRIAAWSEGDKKRWMGMLMQTVIQDWMEKRMEKKSNGWLRSLPEPKVKDLLKDAKPYIHPRFEGEAILSVGKSLDYMDKAVNGLVNVIPFTCMPGGVVDALFHRIKKVKDIPMLTVAFDGQRETNTKNRLEAFVYQVKQHACK